MAQRLRAFLAMATGSDLEWWDTASGDTYVVSSAGITWYEWGIHDTATEDIATAEEEAPDASYAEDKNLLYRVRGPGEDSYYSNAPANMILSSSWACRGLQLSADLPERYSHHHQRWRASGRLRRWIFYRGFPVGRPRL